MKRTALHLENTKGSVSSQSNKELAFRLKLKRFGWGRLLICSRTKFKKLNMENRIVKQTLMQLKPIKSLLDFLGLIGYKKHDSSLWVYASSDLDRLKQI